MTPTARFSTTLRGALRCRNVILPTRAQTCRLAVNISVLDGGTFKLLNLRLTGMYVFPKVWISTLLPGFDARTCQCGGANLVSIALLR
ncbi:MAG: hypothetical protein U1F40_06200 [Turneriella sp.]